MEKWVLTWCLMGVDIRTNLAEFMDRVMCLGNPLIKFCNEMVMLGQKGDPVFLEMMAEFEENIRESIKCGMFHPDDGEALLTRCNSLKALFATETGGGVTH